MRTASILTTLVLLFAAQCSANAQTYAPPTSAPRITSAEAAHRLIVEREVRERFARGLADEARADWIAADREFGRIVDLAPPEPKTSTAYYDRALALAHLRRPNDAMNALDAALARDPGFAAAAANLTALALAAGDDERARRAATRFVAIAPASARARYSEGLVAIRTGDFALARRDFAALVADDPAYAVAHYDLAIVELHDGRTAAAQAELERALALSPGYARARLTYAELLLRDGRTGEAKTELAKTAADAADPALQMLARTLREQLP